MDLAKAVQAGKLDPAWLSEMAEKSKAVSAATTSSRSWAVSRRNAVRRYTAA